MMRNTIRLFLLVETLSFLIAGLIHSGLLVAVEIHPQAAIAESTIGAVLLFALIFALAWPAQTRLIGVVAQLFAAFGTMVGLYTIAVGFGPRSVPDVVFHVAILIVLGWGLVVATRPSGTPALQR